MLQRQGRCGRSACPTQVVSAEVQEVWEPSDALARCTWRLVALRQQAPISLTVDFVIEGPRTGIYRLAIASGIFRITSKSFDPSSSESIRVRLYVSDNISKTLDSFSFSDIT